MKAECTHCGNVFDAETDTFARHAVTGEEAHGCSGMGPDGRLMWYGDRPWTAEETEEYEVQVGGVGTFGMCDPCIDKKFAAMDRAAELRQPCPPRWFDPSFAGEHWDEDY